MISFINEKDEIIMLMPDKKNSKHKLYSFYKTIFYEQEIEYPFDVNNTDVILKSNSYNDELLLFQNTDINNYNIISNKNGVIYNINKLPQNKSYYLSDLHNIIINSNKLSKQQKFDFINNYTPINYVHNEIGEYIINQDIEDLSSLNLKEEYLNEQNKIKKTMENNINYFYKNFEEKQFNNILNDILKSKLNCLNKYECIKNVFKNITLNIEKSDYIDNNLLNSLEKNINNNELLSKEDSNSFLNEILQTFFIKCDNLCHNILQNLDNYKNIEDTKDILKTKQIIDSFPKKNYSKTIKFRDQWRLLDKRFNNTVENILEEKLKDKSQKLNKKDIENISALINTQHITNQEQYKKQLQEIINNNLILEEELLINTIKTLNSFEKTNINTIKNEIKNSNIDNSTKDNLISLLDNKIIENINSYELNKDNIPRIKENISYLSQNKQEEFNKNIKIKQA